MELHTLGVDGGYTQKDIVEVARCLTRSARAPADPAGWAGARLFEGGCVGRLDKVAKQEVEIRWLYGWSRRGFRAEGQFHAG